MKRPFLTYFLALLPFTIMAQEHQGVTLSGSIQSDVLIPQNDEETGAVKDEDFQTNTYADLLLQSQYVDAGTRFEYMEHPLPGFENDFKGWGVPHFWVKGKVAGQELTLGTFYEQFGSGFILRSYEERSLGIDNSLLGGRLLLKPTDGVTVKILSGKQRRYWKWNKSLISGADAEVSIDQWLPALQRNDTRLMVGASWVNRYDDSDEKVYADPTHRIHFPKFVNAWDVRIALDHGAWSLLGEYAEKSDDPSFPNSFIFRKGSVGMLSGSYSKSGLSVLVQAKRSENMSFKNTNSTADVIGISSSINHLPAFSQDHTYALPAFYPYATQLAGGEWACQTEVGYNFKRHTPLGGKYGMNVRVNYSLVRSLDKEYVDGTRNEITGDLNLVGTEGYHSSFFKWGDNTYYQDFNVTVTRRLTKDFKLSVMYMNQKYNMTVVEGEGGMVRSNIFVADGMYQLSAKSRLRTELQYLSTRQDEGSWAFGLLELSLAPHWMFTVSDMWNCGDNDPSLGEENTHLHYYQAQVTYNVGAHRIQAGYGRTVSGYNCSGGVCRYVPETKGFTLSYNYNF